MHLFSARHSLAAQRQPVTSLVVLKPQLVKPRIHGALAGLGVGLV
jgi:hypothetical protein